MVAEAFAGGSSSSASASAVRGSGRVAPAPTDDIIAKAYRQGGSRTKDALRTGLWMVGVGAVIVLLSLAFNARGYYFLFLLIALAWGVGGYTAGRRASGGLSGFWTGLVAGGVGAAGMFMVALLVHSGRLAIFGVGTEWQQVFATGPILGFFDMGGSTASGNGIGLLYMAFVAVMFGFSAAIGVVISTILGAVAGVVEGGHTGEGKTENLPEGELGGSR